jgi:hypothetical protein
MIGRLLCYFGYHDWSLWDIVRRRFGPPKVVRECYRPGCFIQESIPFATYLDQVSDGRQFQFIDEDPASYIKGEDNDGQED